MIIEEEGGRRKGGNILFVQKYIIYTFLWR